MKTQEGAVLTKAKGPFCLDGTKPACFVPAAAGQGQVSNIYQSDFRN